MDPRPVAVAQPYRPLHPLQQLLLGGALSLFFAALVADIAYARTYEVQWTNFASWLLVGAMLLAGATLAWALLSLLAPSWRTRARLLYVALLALGFVMGLVNSLVHAMDAWQKMPAALVWSVLCVVAMALAAWFALRGTWRRQEVVA